LATIKNCRSSKNIKTTIIASKAAKLIAAEYLEWSAAVAAVFHEVEAALQYWTL